MAMFLQQKDVEEAVLIWIQAACVVMIDDLFLPTGDGLEDRSEIKAVLKGQQAAWRKV
jgi:hypothetical protein